MRVLLPLLLTGCAGGAATGVGDDTAETDFCSTLEDGGLSKTIDGGGNSTSGLVQIRVLTNESTDPRDPLYVAFKSYSFENVDSGGVKTVGQTTGDGLVEEQLGAGNWRFSAVYSRGSLLCVAEIDVAVEPNKTVMGCPVMDCP